MNINLIKHLLYMFRCSCSGAEYVIDFTEDNDLVRHSFLVKDNYIGYTRYEEGEVTGGIDCTNLDTLGVQDIDLIPLLYQKVMHSYESGGVYSKEEVNLRHEIELVYRLSKELGGNCYFEVESEQGNLDLVMLDNSLFWCKEGKSCLVTYTCGVYDVRKVIGEYKVTWVYGKSSYYKPYNFYSAKEDLAGSKGLRFIKNRRDR